MLQLKINLLDEYTRCIQSRIPKSIVLKKIVITDLNSIECNGIIIFHLPKKVSKTKTINRVEIKVNQNLLDAENPNIFLKTLLHEVGHCYLRYIFFRKDKNYLTEGIEDFIVDSCAITVIERSKRFILSPKYSLPSQFLGARNAENAKYRKLTFDLISQLNQVYSDLQEIGFSYDELINSATHETCLE
tara:strand:+ start:269 stop:832 length:564 start_codon:yes stop_codon:yes gene_type:complete